MAEPFRVGFVAGVSPGKWLRTWAERLSSDPLEALPVEVEEQGELLRSGAVDMCFVRLPADGTDLHVIPLYEEVPVVVAAKDHPVTVLDELDLSDLAGEHLLQPLADVPEWAAIADEVRDGTRVEPPQMSLAQAIEVAASGAGIVIMPLSLARLHHRKDVGHRPISGVAGSQVGLAWLVGNDDPRVETFIGIVRGRTVRSSRGSRSDDDGAGRATSAGHAGGGRASGGDRARGAVGRSDSARGASGPSGNRRPNRGGGTRRGGPRRGRR